jgi:hypothetical protein
MILIFRELEGSAFITGILLLLVLLGFCAMAWLIFDSYVLLAVFVCWGVVAFVPFLFRVVNLWLVSSGLSLFDS